MGERRESEGKVVRRWWQQQSRWYVWCWWWWWFQKEALRAMKRHQTLTAAAIPPSWTFQVLPSLYQHYQKVLLRTSSPAFFRITVVWLTCALLKPFFSGFMYFLLKRTASFFFFKLVELTTLFGTIEMMLNVLSGFQNRTNLFLPYNKSIFILKCIPIQNKFLFLLSQQLF